MLGKECVIQWLKANSFALVSMRTNSQKETLIWAKDNHELERDSKLSSSILTLDNTLSYPSHSYVSSYCVTCV